MASENSLYDLREEDLNESLCGDFPHSNLI